MGDGMCHKCKGISLLVVGAVVLANSYLNLVGWSRLIGVLLVLGGVMKLVKPHCGCGVPCGTCCAGGSAKSSKPGKRK